MTEPTNLNDLAAIARVTRSAHYRRALSTATAEIERLREQLRLANIDNFNSRRTPMESDIVARLRAVLHNDRSVELMNREAADEIERLNACVAEANAYMAEAALAIERLREQRDEARRRYCVAMAEHGEEAEARQNAEDEGWDCFKENTHD